MNFVIRWSVFLLKIASPSISTFVDPKVAGQTTESKWINLLIKNSNYNLLHHVFTDDMPQVVRI